MCVISSTPIFAGRQTPRSDLDPHCLAVSLFWNAKHKWINGNTVCVCGGGGKGGGGGGAE